MRTLGFEVLAWLHANLPSPSDPRLPFIASDEQATIVLKFYEQTNGSFKYRRGEWDAPKGVGKSPLAAALAVAELACPALRPVRHPPWIQIAGVAEESAYSNVYLLLYGMLAADNGAIARKLGIDLGRGRLDLKRVPGARLEAVTSSAGTREGQRLTFAVFDETHLWTKQNGGLRLARTIRRNLAKMDGRAFELSNAPELGAGSVAEQTAAEYEAGAEGILFVARRPSREPHPDMSDAELLELLAEVYPCSPWVGPDRILREVRDPAVPWQEALRYYYNIPTAGLSAAVDPGLWDSLEEERALPEGARLVLGFDGSHSHDGTALVGCTEDSWLFPVLILERPQKAGEWRVERSRVHRALEHMFGTYDVAFVYADPWQWQSELEEWDARWPRKVVEWPTNSIQRMAAGVDRFRTALREGELHHDGDPDLRRHVLSARLRAVGRYDDGRGRYVLEKAGPGRLIDAAVASVLAFEASAQMPTAKTPPSFAWV